MAMDPQSRNEQMLCGKGSEVPIPETLELTTRKANSIPQKQNEHLAIDIDEARRIIASQSLSSFKLEDFLVITNSNFDLTICDEPYLALLLLYNLKSGKFIARIWNQTVEFGWAHRGHELEVACQRLFKQGKPCIGQPLKLCDENNMSQLFWTSHTPIPRLISKSCHKLLGKHDDIDCHSCSECQKMNNNSEITNDGKNTQDSRKTDEDDDKSMELKQEMFEYEFSPNAIEPNFLEKEPLHVKNPRRSSNLQEKIDLSLASVAGKSLPSSVVHKVEDITWGKLKLVNKENAKEGKVCLWCEKVIPNMNRWCIHRKFYHHYGMFQCPTCQFQCHFAKELLEHMKAEAHSGKIFCQNCKQHLPPDEIEHHYIMCTTGCVTCNKTFANATSLRHHIKYAHKGKYDVERVCCERCGKKFKNSETLKDHVIRIHERRDLSVNRPRPCPICGVIFENYSAMNRHRVTVHLREEYEKQCQKCGLKFRDAGGLNVHMLSHEEPQFKCSFCGKMFKRWYTLEAHERAHKGEKPFLCTICSASFTNQNNLSQHMKGVHKIVGPKGGKVGWVHGKKHKKNDMQQL